MRVAAKPQLTHFLPRDDDETEIVGLTSINGRLYVLRRRTDRQIEVYDATTDSYKLHRQLTVEGLGNDSASNTLTSCAPDNCLYVADFFRSTVFKVELAADDDRIGRTSSWRVDERPIGLSVDRHGDLLVTCHFANKIQRYTTGGDLIGEISLHHLSDVGSTPMSPHHAVQLADDRFAVSLSSAVVLVDSRGELVASCRDRRLSRFNHPCHLAVDKRNAHHVLVADVYNDRIVVLNRSLSFIRQLNVSVSRPQCLFLDDSSGSNRQLLVGEGNMVRASRFNHEVIGGGCVLAFDIRHY